MTSLIYKDGQGINLGGFDALTFSKSLYALSTLLSEGSIEQNSLSELNYLFIYSYKQTDTLFLCGDLHPMRLVEGKG